MKLLVITQSINNKNPILGFFYRWVEEFAKSFEKITIICLEKGKYTLPSNVKVLSLGKENGKSRLKYIFNFYKYIWQERKNYDVVFVHMNQEYVLLGGLLWKMLGKKITMWRNHHRGSFFTYLACSLCDKIFCTSKYSYTAKFKKTVLMPVGIDTDIFKPDNDIEKIPRSILFLGRMSPVKKPDVLINALKILKDKGVKFVAHFYGDPTPNDLQYYEFLRNKVREYGMINDISFEKGVVNDQTPAIYNSHKIFVNLSSSGMYDKTIFEAMACGMLVLASNNNLIGEINESFIFEEDNITDLEEKLEKLLLFSSEDAEESSKFLIKYTEDNNSLQRLSDKLTSQLR